MKGAGVIARRLSDVEPTSVEWLWPGRLPLGYLTMLSGHPGQGKSTLTIELAATITTGRPWPDGTPCDVGDVVFLSAEDGASDVLGPRLDAAAGNSKRVHVIDGARIANDAGVLSEASFSLKRDLDALEVYCHDHAVRLVVVDPVSAYLEGVDDHSNVSVRTALRPMQEFAERHKIAVLIVSVGFVGLAHMALCLTTDPDDDQRRLLLSMKANLAKPAPGLAFALEDAGGCARVRWLPGEVSVSAEEALGGLVENEIS
jgi:hypothetical protein